MLDDAEGDLLVPALVPPVHVAGLATSGLLAVPGEDLGT